MRTKYRVLVIDDSAFIRQFLTDLFKSSAQLEVVATACDPIKAMELLKKQEFDVITLDVEMPQMDGISFLRYIMRFNPTPVVMISSWTHENSTLALKALELGAIDCVGKPTVGYKEGMKLIGEEIITKVTAAATAKIEEKPLRTPKLNLAPPQKLTTSEVSPYIIGIGASTGGTVALGRIFKDLEADLPGIVVVQHMPATFTSTFAKTLDSYSKIRVREAEDGDELTRGVALVTPCGTSLAVIRKSDRYIIRIGPPITASFYTPSINFTLSSIADTAGSNAMGIILTGMGDDGAKGLKKMRDNGAFTIAQDQESCVVYGMPQKAAEYGGVSRVVRLENIAVEINQWGKR